jgi:nucleotide-binding universal stress UspA family protein
MFKVSRVLTPVVFSENCRGALCYAASVASRFGAQLTVLHVLEPLTSLDFDTTTGLEEIERSRHAWVHRGLSAMVRELHPRVKADDACVEGDAATEIIRFAERSGTDLIAIATRGRGAFRRFLLGSVTAKVLHDASCAVLTGAHLEQVLHRDTAGCEFHHVLCAVDFDSQTDSVLDWGIGLSTAYGAKLSLVHIVKPVHDPGRQQEACNEARQRMELWCRTMNTDSVCEVGVGSNVADEVAACTQRLQADLLVIGRGHIKAGGRLRSTSYELLRESPCPVVSI